MTRLGVRLLCLGLVLAWWGGCAAHLPREPVRASVEESKEAPRRVCTILTYNVLGSPDHDETRFPALLRILETADADIVCLQEVEARFLAALKAEPWFQRYQVPQLLGRDAIANGNLVISRFPVERVSVLRHGGRQGRASLLVVLRVGDASLAVATCHLESLLGDGALRDRQLQDVFARLDASTEAVFAGDFNFGDGEQPETRRIPASYLDLWRTLRPTEPGFTWDIDTNDMAARGSFPGERSRRLDRILLRSGRWRPVRIQLVGHQPLDAEGLRFPSDHFGLLGEIGLSAESWRIEDTARPGKR